MTSSREPAPRQAEAWRGETYYGRPQLKPAPFDPWVVGGYIFLAGLSGGAALIGALADVEEMRRPRRRRRDSLQPLARRSRYLSLLAPTIGSMLLIYDLHTPQRFYNMFRVAKTTSPMSIGTWILTTFSVFAGIAGLAQMVGDLRPRWRWTRGIAAAAQIPAGIAGAGLSTYTAALISATSTPLWAAAPRATAVRFASSSIAAAAASLAVSEGSRRTRHSLSDLLLAALTTEAAATLVAEQRYKTAGIEEGRRNAWGTLETIGATGIGVLLPIGILVASRATRTRSDKWTTAAALAAIAGSAAMRVSVLGVGMESARHPKVTMRFAQPDNLPA